MKLAPALLVSVLALAATAQAETVTVPFTTASDGTTGGVLTTESYSGDVTIEVSGTGWSSSTRLNDAFYVFTGGPIAYNPSWYHLRIGTAHPVSQLGGSPPPYNASHEYSFVWDAGPSPAPLRFWVSDGNFSDNGGSYTVTVTPIPQPPTAVITGPSTGVEGSPLTLDGTTSSDPDGPIVAWSWDCESDGTPDATTSVAVCTWPDDGTWTASLTVTDTDGMTDTTTHEVVVANVAPVVTVLTGPTEVDEGSSSTYAAAATDPGLLDTLTWSWDWGDNTSTSGNPASHAWADEGSYSVVATVDDGDGGSATSGLTVDVANVAPTITSTPATTAVEGTAWTYAPTAVDPGVTDVLAWSVSPSAPSAMTLDPSTGALSWTPTYADVATWSFTLFVDDGDGGQDAQVISLSPTALDADADGIDDGWELANGLDPTDPTDAGADPDADGLTNLDEFLGGTDPGVYDGPGVPTLLDPVAGAEAPGSPDLVLQNATDPQGDVLTYDYEVYADAALTTLLASTTGEAEDGSGQTTWKVDVVLPENADAFWRARAADPWVAGAWSPAEAFFVNETNEAPSVPTAATPLDGEQVASLTPLLQMGASADPDGDAVTYEIELADAPDGALAEAISGLIDDGLHVEWTPAPLTEDAWVWLRGRAVDEHGLASDWSEWIGFQPNNEEAAPVGVTWVDPLDGDVVGNQPVLVATGAVDPEGADVVYEFEIPDGALAVTNTVSPDSDGFARWDLAADDVHLPENWSLTLSVRAGDGVVWSPWVSIEVWVNGENEAPGVPVLVAPPDGTAYPGAADLVAAWAGDADEDALSYDFVVATDAELTDVIASIDGLDGGNAITDGTGEVAWPITATLPEGTLYWSARATDGELASDWAAPWTLTVAAADVPTEDPITPGDTPDCGCSASADDAPATWAWLLLLVPLVRRRR